MRKLLIIVVFALSVLSPLLTLAPASAHTSRPQSPMCAYWSVDAESSGWDTSWSPQTPIYMDVSLSSLRTCGTGQFQGREAGQVCFTTASKGPNTPVIWQKYGLSTDSFAHARSLAPIYANTRYCWSTGSFALAPYSTITLFTWLTNIDDNDITNTWSTTDYTVH